MTLVLLILAAIWAAVLIPPVLRNRAEGRPADSITAFHRQLAVLRRAGPRSTRHANSLPSGILPAAHRHVSLVDPISQPVVRPAAFGVPIAVVRHSARQRRRDIFMALLVAAGITFVLGAIPALRMLWLVHVAADFLLIGYVGLLVRQRNLASERDLKVRLLPVPRRHEAGLEAEGRWMDPESGWLAEPALLRRSAN
ncbi:MAG: hypothetical protein ABR540_19265 [Acidimicrobiales bacterium]